MAIVKDYYIGNTHVIFHDDYIVKTQEEVDAILDSLGQMMYEQELRRLAQKRMAEEAVKG